MSARRHISNVGRPQDGLAGGLQCYPLDAVSPAYLPADIQSWAHPRIHRSSLDRRRQRLAANRVINSPMLWLLLLLLLLMVVILVDDDYAEETRASRTHTHSGLEASVDVASPPAVYTSQLPVQLLNHRQSLRAVREGLAAITIHSSSISILL